MKKGRVAAFTDAVLAIIMTILVLELEKPSTPALSAVWELKHSFFSYTLSFFWLGSMWVNIHNEWERIEKISAKTREFDCLQFKQTSRLYTLIQIYTAETL
ncbi:MAG: DUF1211 domain-containing protein [Firmicutes bacterium]|nr:DUF1211 domain-containing protein [Bacillota bacterium]